MKKLLSIISIATSLLLVAEEKDHSFYGSFESLVPTADIGYTIYNASESFYPSADIGYRRKVTPTSALDGSLSISSILLSNDIKVNVVLMKLPTN